MYNRFYGFQKKPFENSPDPEFLYRSTKHREILSSLQYGIEEGKGFILVAGDVGTGKTTLLNSLLQELPPDFLCIHIINPKSLFTDIIQHLATKLGIDHHTLNQLETIDVLKEGLLKLNRTGAKAVILIDEAHLLDINSLEEIRLISNIEDDKNKLVQIVLVGQEEIITTLEQKEMRPLVQRLVIVRKLERLNYRETREYIDHRLEIAGGSPRLFRESALKLIYRKSRGTPRLINHICDNALLIGYALGARDIDRSIIKEVINDMELKPRKGFFNLSLQPLLKTSSVLLVAGLACTWLLFGEQDAIRDLLPTPTKRAENREATAMALQPAEHPPMAKEVQVIKTSMEQRRLDKPAKQRVKELTIENKKEVKPGEWLRRIIRTEYGTVNETIIDLVHVANPDLKDIDILHPGDTISLPDIHSEDMLVRGENENYHIHFASFYSFDQARLEAEKLARLDHRSFVVPAVQGKNRVYRVYLGIFADREEAVEKLSTISFSYLPF